MTSNPRRPAPSREPRQDERIDAWVAEQLAKPEAQGPLPRRAQQVLSGLAANGRRVKKRPA